METAVLDTEILKYIAQNTDSGLIIFFVIFALVSIPVSILFIKSKKHHQEIECKRREQDSKRELNIIKVITSNTEIMTGLKTTLEANNETLNAAIDRIHKRIDDQNNTLQALNNAVSLINIKS